MSHPALLCSGLVLLLVATSGAQPPEPPPPQGVSGVQSAAVVPAEAQVPTLAVPTTTTATSRPDAAETSPEVEVVTPKIAFKLVDGGAAPKAAAAALGDVVTTMLGSKCSVDQDCSALNHTKCTDGMCLCSNGYIPSKRKMDVCLKVPSGLGDGCEEVHQCEHAVNSSECKDNKCSCPLNYVFNQSRCWEKQMLGGKCNVTAQCEDVTFAACLQGVCTCEDPLIPSPINKCLAPAGTVYKAPCVEDIQCSHSFGDQAHCASGECVCTVNHHFNGTKCTLDKKLGEACLTDSDCDVSDATNAEGSRTCVGNACICATGFSSLPGEDICTRSSGEELAVSLTWVLCIVLAKYYLA